MNHGEIQPGQQRVITIRRRDIAVQVASRVIVRGDWWHCRELDSGRTRLVHASEFRHARAHGEKRPHRLRTAAGIMAMAVLVYLLSAGPAYSMHRREAISASTFKTVYWPILQLADCHQAVDSMARWYARWWA